MNKKFYHCFWCQSKLNPLYMLCNINTDDDTICDNDYCYTRYLEHKNDFKMFYNKKPGVCDFCRNSPIFNKEHNKFCCGMCMDRYQKCLVPHTPENELFVDLKRWQQHKNKLNEKLKQTDKNIKNLNIQITLLTIE